MKFRKRPVVIEAEHILSYLDIPRIVSWIEAHGGKAAYGQEPDGPAHMLISTLEGVMTANVGDWIIKGVNGEFYPCKDEIFQKTYEAVEKV